jgi:YVTN family beta-propeller protein
VIDIANQKAVGTVPVGRRPYAVALSSGRAFVTNQYANTLSVIDTTTLKVVKTLAVGDYPEGIASDPARSYVYVACWFDNILMRVDTAKMTAAGEVEVGDGPRAFGVFLR